MSEHAEDHTTSGVRTVAVTSDRPLTLEFIGQTADLDLYLDAHAGSATLRFSGAGDVDLALIDATIRDGRLRVDVPPIVDPGGGPALAFNWGRRRFTLGRLPRLAVEAHLPEGSGLHLDSGAGDLTVSGVPGSGVRVKTSSGDITLEQVTGARVETGSGDVHADLCEGATITTGSGDIDLSEASGAVQLRTGSGDVIIEGFSGELTVASGSGDVECSYVTGGTITARTGSGDIRVGVREGLAVWQELSSVSGDVDRTLTPRGEPAPGVPFVTVRAASTSGDVTLADA